MKNVRLIGTLMGFLCLQSCSEDFKPSRPAHISSYELVGKDTINLTDQNGLKQGIWITNSWGKNGEKIFLDTFMFKDGVEQKIH